MYAVEFRFLINWIPPSSFPRPVEPEAEISSSDSLPACHCWPGLARGRLLTCAIREGLQAVLDCVRSQQTPIPCDGHRGTWVYFLSLYFILLSFLGV
jgi:hypothetical protein